MDFETIKYEESQIAISNETQCRVCLEKDLSWNYGETIDFKLPIVGGFITDNEEFISIAEFLQDSKTLYLKVVLSNFLGEKIDTQIIKPEDLDYYEDDTVAAYYGVDVELSQKLRPGSYKMEVTLINTLPAINPEILERTILNTKLTGPEGLDITII